MCCHHRWCHCYHWCHLYTAVPVTALITETLYFVDICTCILVYAHEYWVNMVYIFETAAILANLLMWLSCLHG